jgi:sugar transferase EpsL
MTAGGAKRLLDLILIITLAPLWVPIFLILTGVVWLRLGSPVLFRQERPGYRGNPFSIIKFRTMTDARGSDGQLLADAERLVPFGRWLRSTSLDELPELFNVLKGEMTLVGPRPLLMEYLPLYTERQARRHLVKPGLTGWSQVNGRNALSWEEKLEMDVWYVENRTLLLDVKILLRTFMAVFLKKGITAPGHETVPHFTGSK